MVTLTNRTRNGLQFDLWPKEKKEAEVVAAFTTAKTSIEAMLKFIDLVFQNMMLPHGDEKYLYVRRTRELAQMKTSFGLFKRIDYIAPAIRALRIHLGEEAGWFSFTNKDAIRFATQAESVADWYLVWRLTPTSHYRKKIFRKMIDFKCDFWESVAYLSATSYNKQLRDKFFQSALSQAKTIEEFEAIMWRSACDQDVRYQCYRKIVELLDAK